MKSYTVRYNCNGYKDIQVFAKNAADAYGKAFYEAIPHVEGECPYSAWVYCAESKNGNVHYFNTCEGRAY